MHGTKRWNFSFCTTLTMNFVRGTNRKSDSTDYRSSCGIFIGSQLETRLRVLVLFADFVICVLSFSLWFSQEKKSPLKVKPWILNHRNAPRCRWNDFCIINPELIHRLKLDNVHSRFILSIAILEATKTNGFSAPKKSLSSISLLIDLHYAMMKHKKLVRNVHIFGDVQHVRWFHNGKSWCNACPLLCFALASIYLSIIQKSKLKISIVH